MKIEMKPIGYVKSPFKQRKETPAYSIYDESTSGILKVNEDLAEALVGLEKLDHLMVIWNFHLSDPEAYKERMSFGSSKYFEGIRGIFGTRTPFRPNPIAVTIVEVEAVVDTNIRVRGLDMVDGTPILDIKPYTVRNRGAKEDE